MFMVIRCVVKTRICFRIDGFYWFRTNKNSLYSKRKSVVCSYKAEFQQFTFFERSKLSIFQIPGFVDLWVDNASLVLIRHHEEISQHAAIVRASFCREVVSKEYCENPEKITRPFNNCEVRRMQAQEFFRLASEMYNPLIKRGSNKLSEDVTSDGGSCCE